MPDSCCYPDREQWDLLWDQPIGTCIEMHGRLKGWWMVRGRSRSFLCHPDGRCDCWSKADAPMVTPCAHLRALQAHLDSLPPKVPCPACKGKPGACAPCHSEGWVYPHEAEEMRVAWPLYESIKARFREDLDQEAAARLARGAVTWTHFQRLNEQPAKPAAAREEKQRRAA
jgi:hypothetical protein